MMESNRSGPRRAGCFLYRVYFELDYMNKIAKLAALTITATIFAGCYREQPLETLPPRPATRLIAQLTDSGTVAMSNAIGAGALAVEGVITNADERTWTLQMLRVDHRDGRVIDWKREPVVFPASVLTSARVKVLDKRRSWLAAGGIVIGAFIVARTFDLAGIGEDDDDGEEPQQILIPVGGR
jgi:hypothetical protein